MSGQRNSKIVAKILFNNIKFEFIFMKDERAPSAPCKVQAPYTCNLEKQTVFFL